MNLLLHTFGTGGAFDLALLGLLAGAIALTLLRSRQPTRRRIAQRMRLAVTRAGTPRSRAGGPDAADQLKETLSRHLAFVGERVSMFGPDQRAALAGKLMNAGFRDRRAVAVMVGLKLFWGTLFALAAIAGGPFVPRFGEIFAFRALMMAGAFVIGLIVPEYALGFVARQRKKAIAVCLSDAIDLLVICTNAGNSLLVSIKRVAQELTRICPPLADELKLTADELQVSGNIASALRNLALRTGLPSLRSLATTLIQSQQYGTPITQALRTLSQTMRKEQMVTLEEKAAKLAPKMTVPMMLFILPTVAMIAAGPAIIRLIAVFHNQQP
ncbi:type II secretion system F family protein [Trinickia terrae]|uniref:Type II secretion system F family protein n=1 Tax=Trinickia terrae TaxID=2571161 RepID=A0A4U1HZR1_9BURK|nr:type II secretion system F family protein [Trinickia terrae]TKC86254.1 type II secretion system F family protein [Trinickia terrae]